MRFLRTISARLLGPAADMAADMAVEPAHHRVRRAAQPDARSEARSEAVPSGGFAPRTARALKPFGDAMGSAMSGAKDRLEDIGGGTGLTGQKQPEIGPTGIIDVGDDYFKQVCLLKDDGTMYVVKDRNTARLAEDLADLERQYRLPEITRRLPATLEEIARMRAEALRATLAARGNKSENAGSRRILLALKDAARLGASDVKLIKRATHADLRLKLANIEIDHGPQWTLDEAGEAISYLYDAKDDGTGQSAQQEGSYQPFSVSAAKGKLLLPDGVLALRAAKGPQGQLMDDFLVLRLVTPPSGTGLGDLEGLGFTEDVLAELERERSSESGLLLMGGSTGDGKSTTLVRWLERVYIERAGRVSIVTVEDPIEFPARGSGFIQMVVAGGSSGAERRAAITETLSNFVRMNPTFGMVGEIRSVDDARETMQFVVSGHKIVTTIHAASANAALFRLIRLGVRPEEVAEPGVISLAMRQTLVPVLCPDCARPATPPERAIINAWAGNHTGNPEGAPMMRNRAGCPTCLPPEPGLSPLVLETRRAAWGGLSRRQAIAEYIRLDDTYREFLQARDALRAERYWRTPKEDGGMGGVPLDVIKARLVAEGRVDYTDASEKHLPGTAGDADAEALA